MTRNVLRLAILASACTAIVGFTTPAGAELHGTCAGCSDNGTITPMDINPASFGFTSSPDSGTADFLLEVLVPNNVTGANAESIAITGTNTTNASVTGTIFSSTSPWTSDKLSAYLGNGANSNPISAFLTDPSPSTDSLDPGATGYYVYQFDFGDVTFGSSTDPLFSTTFGLPLGTVITAFTDVTTTTCKKDKCTTSTDWTPTANSAALIETETPPGGGGPNGGPVPEPATLALLGAGLVGAAGLRRRRKTQAGA